MSKPLTPGKYLYHLPHWDDKLVVEVLEGNLVRFITGYYPHPFAELPATAVFTKVDDSSPLGRWEGGDAS